MANGKRNRNRSKRNGNTSTGPSRTPVTTLRRTFRYFDTVKLNNTAGAGTDRYAYYSSYLTPQPQNALGFKDAQQTFEFWKIRRFRVRVQPGYNAYNQSYNTINLDALAAMQIWTAADFSFNESVSGVSVCSYNNAKVHTLSLNGIKTIVNTECRINQKGTFPFSILPGSTCLDTSTDTGNSNVWSGAQLFMRMQGNDSSNYLPSVQLIYEVDVEFKQPAYQNRPDTFEVQIVGSKLVTIPDGSNPESTREYVVTGYTLNDTGNVMRLERADGQPGSLDYTQEEFWEVYFYQKSGKYFNDRPITYDGPVPRKPLSWQPTV